jgi:peptidoglycan/xylan/chitin deacetylase (PgdA/CDA1 family)
VASTVLGHPDRMSRRCARRWLAVSVFATVTATACDVSGVGGGSSTVPTSRAHGSPIVPATTVAATVPPASSVLASVPSPSGGSVLAARLPGAAKVVALTIDVERDAEHVDTIVDTLDDRGVLASFGITGAVAETYPDVVEHIARGGHLVMSHSDAHRSFTGRSSGQQLLTRSARQADLRAADSALSALIGRSTKPYWRPPYGDVDAGVLADVGAIGYSRTVLWSVDSLGWSGLGAEAIVERVLGAAEPGAIILMHAGSHSQDGLALGRIIDGLRAEGYSFVTLDEGLPA